MRLGKRQQEKHQSDEQQYVDDLADGVHAGDAQCPDDEQSHCELEEHGGLPSGVDSAGGIAR
jgi:hypothetical protein